MSEGEPGAEGLTGSEPAAAREAAPRIIPLRGSRGAASFGALPAVLPPPDGVEALYYEGMAAYQHRHWEEALDRFTRLKEAQPSRPGLDALLDEVRWFLQLQAAAPAVATTGGDTDARRTLRPNGQSARRPVRVRMALYLVLAALALAALLLVAYEDRLPWRSDPTAEELYDRAQARLAAGDYEGAQAAFEKVLDLSPSDPEARLGLERAQQQQILAQDYAAAEAAIAEEDWDRASAELASILALDPTYAEAQARSDFVVQRRRLMALYTDGGRLYDLGRWEQALEQFETIRAIDSTYRTETVNEFLFVCYMSAGEALLKTERISSDNVKAAVAYFEQALAIHPRNRTASDARRRAGIFLDALAALSAGDNDHAISHLVILMADAPTFAGGQAAKLLYDLIVAAGLDALKTGDIPAALARFERAEALPVNDNSAARQGMARARAATPTPVNTATFTPIPVPQASAASGPINVRSGPDDSYPIIGQVAEAAVVTITARRDDGAWLRVCCVADGREGWVAASAVQVVGPLEQAEVVRRPTPTAGAPTIVMSRTPAPVQSVCVQGHILNVAGGHGLAGWTVRLADASGVEQIARTDEAGFYRFTDIATGLAAVRVELPAGWRSVSPLPGSIVAAPGAACAMIDFWSEQSSSAQSDPGALSPDPSPTPIR